MSKTAKWTLTLLLVAYFIFCTLIIVLKFVVLPHVENYKSEIEQFASQKIGRTVLIEKINASWSGLNPQLALSNIAMRDHAGQLVLSLPQVNATLSWWSLVVFDARFSNIKVVQPSLYIQRDIKGQVFIAGFPIQENQKNDGKGLKWVLEQHEIEIKQGEVHWLDLYRQAPELKLSKVEFLLKNKWHQHQFALKAHPPKHIAAPIDVRGDFKQSVFQRKNFDFTSWTGDFYADFHQANLIEIHRYIDFPFSIEKGLGSVRAWTSLDKGRVADLTLDVALIDVIGKFRKDLPKLDMAKVSGRIMASEPNVKNRRYLPELTGRAGHTLALENFSMTTRAGVVLPKTTLSQQYFPAEKGKPQKNELHAQLLDLESIANFVEHLPIPKDQRELLIELKPKGQLIDFTASWQGIFPEVSKYKIKGKFNHLYLKPLKAQLARAKSSNEPARAAVPSIPGFENLSGSIDASDAGGSFQLNSENLTLQLPSYFVDPVMPFNTLNMQARWQFQPNNRLLFQVSTMDFVQDAAKGSFTGKHLIEMGKSFQENKGIIDITGKLQHFDLKTIKRFIPEQSPEDLRHWLSDALLDGMANDVSVTLKGNMNYFPFNQNDEKAKAMGEFNIHGKIENGHLNFVPGALASDGKAPLWPTIEKIQGDFSFDRTRMEIRADKAQTHQSQLSKVKAIIPDLLDPNNILHIDGLVNGQLHSMFQYVKASPVDELIGGFLHDSTALGNAQLNLKLQLPLHDFHSTKVNGILQFNGNETKLQPDLPKMSNLTGRLEFDEHGIQFNMLKANMLGGPVMGIGSTVKDGSIRIRLDGNASAEGIQSYFTDPSLLALTQRIYGSTRYSAQVNVKKGQPEIIVESSMQGLGLSMPAPLVKAMNDVLPIRLEITPDQNADAGQDNFLKPYRDEMKLTIGSLLNARYQRVRSKEKNAHWKVIRGGIGIYAPSPWPESGLHAHVIFNTLNMDEWNNLLNRKIVPAAVSSAIASNVPKNTANQQKAELFQYIEPNLIAVQTEELFVMGKKLDKVVLGASNQNGIWQANVDATQASGYVTWSASQHNLGHLTARLSRLIIPKSAANDVGDLLEGKNTTQEIPSLDIIVDQFELFNKKLGRLELMASNEVIAKGREWTINKLNLKNTDSELLATGKWRLFENSNKTNLNYELNIQNAGKLLDRLHFADVMKGGTGKLEGDIQWNGLPFLMDMPSLSGQVKMKLESGQFLKVDSGAAKLLGVLSMQSLPRRLTLDFRDVFSEGFSFDNIVGDALIQQGIAKTDNFKMSSINAAVLIEGSADIAKETQDLHVAVVPDLNAGAASVVYGLAVNPVIGLGTFLAQLLFRDPLRRAFTYEYTITGPWKSPVVTKLENKEREIYLEKQKLEKIKFEKQKLEKKKEEEKQAQELKNSALEKI